MKNLLSNIYIFFVNKHNEKIEREAIIDLLFNGTALKIFLGVKEGEYTAKGLLNIRKKDGLKDIS
ncbi:hypothetical protein DRN58_10075 [Thermococci archaeon]|nr:MAG: hypothetical protein DRN58_10075 [Thermococci archaeon]